MSALPSILSILTPILPRGWILLLVALCAAPAGAGESLAPLALRNLSPLYANLGIPVMTDARLPAAGQWRAGAQLQVASHALRHGAAGPRLELDGETRRVDLRIAYGLSQRLRLQLDIPWIQHSGGALDGLIDDWHGFWGMPDGPRGSQPSDRLYFLYDDGSGGGWLLEDGRSGIGDMELGADLALLQNEGQALSLFTSVKFASGEVEDFTGSGETGFAVGLRGSRSGCLLPALQCQFQLGGAYLGDSPLDPRARRWTPFYGISLAWPLTPQLALLAQLEGQGEVYRSAALDRDDAPVLGALALRWTGPSGWVVDAAFSEDLKVGSAPDISFQLGLRRHW